jgi:DNA-binding CsgD family transcriptional regulator
MISAEGRPAAPRPPEQEAGLAEQALLLQLYRLARVTPVQEFPQLAREMIRAWASRIAAGPAPSAQRQGLLASLAEDAIRLNASLQPGPDGPAHALLSAQGALLLCTQAFTRLIAGPAAASLQRLPVTQIEALLHGQGVRIAAGSVEIRPVWLGCAWLLHAGAVPLSRRLTSREYSIARRFGAGQDYREIAEEMDLPLGAVRSTLQRIYRKLEITGGKARLAELLLEEG